MSFDIRISSNLREWKTNASSRKLDAKYSRKVCCYFPYKLRNEMYLAKMLVRKVTVNMMCSYFGVTPVPRSSTADKFVIIQIGPVRSQENITSQKFSKYKEPNILMKDYKVLIRLPVPMSPT